MNTLKVLGTIALVLGVVFSVVVSAGNKEDGVSLDDVRMVVQSALESVKGTFGGGIDAETTNYNRIGYGEAVDKVVHGVISGTLKGSGGSGEAQESWFNNLGSSIRITDARFMLIGNASSTLRFHVGTSTASTVTIPAHRMDQLPPPSVFRRSIVDGWDLATSTSATTTTSWAMIARPGLRNGSTVASGDEGIMEEPWPVVRVGEYINLLKVEANFPTSCSGATCEAASSTNWGADIYYEIEYTATSTQKYP